MTFLENIRERLEESKGKMQQAQARLAAAQTEFQAAQTDFNSWTWALNAETRRQQAMEAATPKVEIAKSENIQAAEDSGVNVAGNSQTGDNEPNKTQFIQGLLNQHPAGLTPPELWKLAEGTIKNRAYLYSILKRLKDRELVATRRGKYSLRVPLRQEEAKENITLQ